MVMNTKHTRSEFTANMSLRTPVAQLANVHVLHTERVQGMQSHGWTVGKNFFQKPAQRAKR